MQMIRVSSVNLNSIGYDNDSATMRVLFNDGSTYDYLNVPKILFINLANSSSKGEFFSKNIKKLYKFKKIS
jgi:hypothetical protein